MSPAISSQLAFDVTKICAVGLSLISVSMTPRRTRTVLGVVVFLLIMGEPQVLQKYFVCPGVDSYPDSSPSPFIK